MKKTMLRSIVAVSFAMCVSASAMAAPDPDFYIFLCIGQSNMEGAAVPESCDYENIDDRFLMYAAVDNSELGRVRDNWYTATPPLNNPNSGLTPVDWFGRTMARALPEEVRIGVINVAVGGCKIELFDPVDNSAALEGAEEWFLNSCARYDESKPYLHLLKCARKAQEAGVIKGILLHQGESNNGDTTWPVKVKKVYDALIADLGLNAEETPLLAGETLRREMGGVCWAHNSVIAGLPNTIANAHVVSSEGCAGADDGLHFLAEGYRKLGYNYAKTLLTLWGMEVPEEWVRPADAPGHLWDGRYTGKYYPPLRLSKTKFADVNEGDMLSISYTVAEGCEEAYPGLIFNDGADTELRGAGVISFSKDRPGDFTHHIGVTKAMLSQLRASGLAISRPGSTVTSVDVVAGDGNKDLSSTLWFGNSDLSELSSQYVSATTFASVKVGDELRFHTSGSPVLRFDWNSPVAAVPGDGYLSFTVDAASLSKLKTSGVFLTGGGVLTDVVLVRGQSGPDDGDDSMFPFSDFDPSIWKGNSGNPSWDAATGAFHGGQYGQGGWRFETPVDLSEYDEIVVELKEPHAGWNTRLMLCDRNTIWNGSAQVPLGSATTIRANLHNLNIWKQDASYQDYKTDELLDPARVYFVMFWTTGETPLMLERVYVVKSSGGTADIYVAGQQEDIMVYNIQGMPVLRTTDGDALLSLPEGLYIVNGKKRLLK